MVNKKQGKTWKTSTGPEICTISRIDTFDVCATYMTFFGLHLHLKMFKSFIQHIRASIQCIQGLDWIGLHRPLSCIENKDHWPI